MNNVTKLMTTVITDTQKFTVSISHHIGNRGPLFRLRRYFYLTRFRPVLHGPVDIDRLAYRRLPINRYVTFLQKALNNRYRDPNRHVTVAGDFPDWKRTA